MVNITIKDLLHQKLRFFLIILGLTVSIVMVNCGIGFLTGAMHDNESFLDNNPQFDGFITQNNRENIFDGGQVHDSVYNETKRLEVVKNVEKLIIEWLGFKDEDEIVGCVMIGYNTNSDFEPWDIVKGEKNDLKEDLTAIVDISIKRYLPNLEIGDKIESSADQKVKIVGFCENSKHWGNPYVWVSFETALSLYHIENQNVSTILAVELKSGYSANDIEKSLDNNDINVLSREEIIDDLETDVMDSMGSSIGLLALMGFCVTMIIISSTMYSTVLEKIPELVSMKALGASQGFINKLLISQVLIFITISSALALVTSFLIQPLINTLTLYSLGFTPFWLGTTYIIAMLLGMFCSLASIRKVKKADPAVIFRS